VITHHRLRLMLVEFERIEFEGMPDWLAQGSGQLPLREVTNGHWFLFARTRHGPLSVSSAAVRFYDKGVLIDADATSSNMECRFFDESVLKMSHVASQLMRTITPSSTVKIVKTSEPK
jgi:hypothetical protein